MYSLIEKTFIAWGGNEELAKLLSKNLKKLRVENIVGGHATHNGEYFDHLGPRVISQMKQASSAIILAQGEKIDDGTYRFRPNLMFEWGYLLSRLPRGSIFVVLIDTPREAVASDLQGIFSEILPDNLPNNNKRSRWIANQFLQRSPAPEFSPSKVCYNWSESKIFLQNQINKETSPSPHEFLRVLISSFIPAVYTNDIIFIRTIIDEVRKNIENANNSSLMLATGLCKYVEYVTQNYKKYRKNDFTELKRKFSNCANAHDPYVSGIARNYMGKCLLKEYELEKNGLKRKELLQNSRTHFYQAKNKIEISPIDDNSKKLWLSFIFRHLALTTYEIEGPSETAIEYAELSMKFRYHMSEFFSSSFEKGISDFFEAEYYLSVCDYVKISESPDIQPFHDLPSFSEDETKSNWLWKKVYRVHAEIKFGTG